MVGAVTRAARVNVGHTDGPWTIAQIAAEFDVTHRTVRHYEELGLITPERRGKINCTSPVPSTHKRTIMVQFDTVTRSAPSRATLRHDA